MRELILARHAKSDWGDARLADHDRPLNARGLRDAPRMARHLAADGVMVERILASTALRARSTAEVYGAQLGVAVELDAELYLAPAQTLLRKAAASGATSVMIVAHDPGISDLASLLSNDSILHMPTCAVARFVWSVDSWGDAITHSVDEWSFAAPKLLA